MIFLYDFKLYEKIVVFSKENFPIIRILSHSIPLEKKINTT